MWTSKVPLLSIWCNLSRWSRCNVQASKQATRQVMSMLEAEDSTRDNDVVFPKHRKALYSPQPPPYLIRLCLNSGWGRVTKWEAFPGTVYGVQYTSRGPRAVRSPYFFLSTGRVRRSWARGCATHSSFPSWDFRHQNASLYG